jgi:hypothetical protein
MPATAPRTDVHRPSALVTEDYDYVLCYDAHPTEGDRRELMAYINRTGRHFGENHSAGSCYHCGARMRYTAVLLHKPTDTLVKVGEQCLDNRFALASADFHRLRKAAELNRQRHARKMRREAWFAVDNDRLVAFEWAKYMVNNDHAYGYNGMRHDFVSTVNRGEWMPSDKFVRAIMRDMTRTERIAEERAAAKAQAMPVVDGNGIDVSGEVVSVKLQENDFGVRQVMTVRDDRGFMVWGTVPAAIDDVARGDHVKFVANITKSDRDDTFGFFKRPRKAVIA